MAIDGEYDGWDSDIWPSDTGLFRKRYTNQTIYAESNSVTVTTDTSTNTYTFLNNITPRSNDASQIPYTGIQWGPKEQRILDVQQMTEERGPIAGVGVLRDLYFFRQFNLPGHRDALIDLKAWVDNETGALGGGGQPWLNPINLDSNNKLPTGLSSTNTEDSLLPWWTPASNLLANVGAPTNWHLSTPQRSLDGRVGANPTTNYAYTPFGIYDYGWKYVTNIINAFRYVRNDSGWQGVARGEGFGVSTVSWADAQSDALSDFHFTNTVLAGIKPLKYTKGSYTEPASVPSWNASIFVYQAFAVNDDASGINSHTVYAYCNTDEPSPGGQTNRITVYDANSESSAAGGEAFTTTNIWYLFSVEADNWQLSGSDTQHISATIGATNLPAWCDDPTAPGDEKDTFRGFVINDNPLVYEVYEFDYN